MGPPVHWRQTDDRSAINTPPPDRVAAEESIASTAYLVWPLAIYAALAPRPDASNWFRFHLRQALWFGGFTAAAALLALVWPLVLSMFVGNVVATLWIYLVALLLDVALFVLWLVLAIRYSQRAARGETFEIPFIERFVTATGTGRKK